MRQKEYDDAGYDAADRPGEEPDHQPVEGVEARFRVRAQSADLAFDTLEAIVDFPEAAIHLLEAPIDLLEAEVHPFRHHVEAEVDSLRELVDAFFGARLGHRLHG